MRWTMKAAAQRGIGALPAADRVNYLLQRRVSKGLPRSDDSFQLHVDETVAHFGAFRRLLPETEPAKASFYEFGAGWDLIAAVVLFCLGVERQTLVDIRRNVRVDLVNTTLARIADRRDVLQRRAGLPFRELPRKRIGSLDELDVLGITYLAPCDARGTGLRDASIDFISNTFTLEHIPADDIRAILVESRRILRPSGVVSSSIDMQDHYSFSDGSISAYNYLKFSDPIWRLINSPIHYQNRLRLPDYEQLFGDAGLEIVERSVIGPTPDDERTLESIELAERFRSGYDIRQLGVREATILARRP